MSFSWGGCVNRFTVLLCAMLLSGCSAFPGSVQEGIVEISQVTAAIECELAAVATDPDPDVRSKAPETWGSLTDLDLTLVRSLGGDAAATVTAPVGLGTFSTTPKLSLTGTDTRTGHIQFSTNILAAKKKYGASCSGDDPSETHMGMANWFIAALKAIEKGSLAGVTYTKQFEIVANPSARFGYTLIPVTNTVSIDSGIGGTYDRTSRFSVALAPQVLEGPKKPIPVYIVSEPSAGAGAAGPGLRGGRVLPASPARVTNNPELYYLLQRKSPVPLAR